MFPTYHIYPPTAPHVAYMQPKANAPSFFMADELRQVSRIWLFFFFQQISLCSRLCSNVILFIVSPSGVNKQTFDHHGPDWPLRESRYKGFLLHHFVFMPITQSQIGDRFFYIVQHFFRSSGPDSLITTCFFYKCETRSVCFVISCETGSCIVEL